jgi:aspartate kinase
MLVFKFGGASVKDAEAVINVAGVLSHYQNEKVVVVISAMGKTTNALEKLVNAFMNKSEARKELLNEVKAYHEKIMQGLGFNPEHGIWQQISNCFTEIEWMMEDEPDKGYNFVYDQIVSQGELISTRIVSAYLQDHGHPNVWMDARDLIRTDNTYREGNVNWELTLQQTGEKIPSLFEKTNLIITQGFIGGTSENYSTTLGREGSDYTAAIISFCMDAREMVVWKDVPGVLNADPKYRNDAVKLDEISYHDAIELTYYGATVIHPKTIKPLENKNIPLCVRSFKAPEDQGTRIGNYETTKPLVPCYIFKPDQILISISARDFSFIAEESLSKIYRLFAEHNIKINLMQNSAISFSVCVDNDPFKVPELIKRLKTDFQVLYNDKLRLITIRHYTPETLDKLLLESEILIEQRSRHTAQVVIPEHG